MIRDFEEHSPVLADNVWIDPDASVIGDVQLGKSCSVWPGVIIRADINSIRIGADTNIQDACVLHVTHPSPFFPKGHALTVGKRVTIGHKVILHGCEIADDCLIGMGCIVMDGAIIESETIVGAGSVVPGGKRLESGYLYVGSPARRVRALSEDEKAFFAYSASHYVKLADRHRRSIDQ